MPSSKNYKRDFGQEASTAKARGEQGTGSESGSAIRHKARRKAIKLGMIEADSAKDIHHKKPLSKGGAKTAAENLQAESAGKNRSFPRTSKGAVRKP